jgi:acyl-CoA thioester hydrolase
MMCEDYDLPSSEHAFIMAPMSEFHFSVIVEARYSDLDPQWHVNNVRYLAYLEHARLSYLVKLGLWDGLDFNQLGLIVADIHIAYIAPMLLFQKARIELRTARIGTKSMTFEYRLSDETSGVLLATAETVMVGFDYNEQQSIPIPADWREKIAAFEKTAF